MLHVLLIVLLLCGKKLVSKFLILKFKIKIIHILGTIFLDSVIKILKYVYEMKFFFLSYCMHCSCNFIMFIVHVTIYYFSLLHQTEYFYSSLLCGIPKKPNFSMKSMLEEVI